MNVKPRLIHAAITSKEMDLHLYQQSRTNNNNITEYSVLVLVVVIMVRARLRMDSFSTKTSLLTGHHADIPPLGPETWASSPVRLLS